ncbi:hypothetical protein RI367_003447 [Sorochytrium milnesiophthora]
MGGSTSQYQNAPLASPLKPLAVFAPTFCLSHAVTLTVKQKVSLNGNEFSAKDADGRLWFRSDGRSFSWSDKVVLYDANEQAVLNIKRKSTLWTNKYVMHVGAGSGQVVVNIVAPLTWGGASYRIAVTLRDGRCVDLSLKGSAWRYGAYIFMGHPREGGQLVAKIARTPGIISMDKFSIEAAPNVDIALLVVLTILFMKRR